MQIMAGQWMKIFICVLIMLSTQAYRQSPDIANVTFIENAEAKGAVCLDGTPGAYHYSPGFGDGANNWIVYLPGGGWCDSVLTCLLRTRVDLGSTKNITYTLFGIMFRSNQSQNPDFYNWNKVLIRYCDGASFMANVEAVDPVTKLHYRGGRIFSAVIEELLAKGMNNAANAMLVGNSAGGLATIYHCDRFRAYLLNASRVKCFSDSGFFIHGKGLRGVKRREAKFADIISIHQLAGILPTSCTSRMNPNLCLFPEYMIGDIQTPLFILNSDFDRFQVTYNLQPHDNEPGWDFCANDIQNCTPSQLQNMKDFRTTFLKTLNRVPDSPSRGWFITSCYVHDFVYRGEFWLRTIPPLRRHKTIAKAVGDWFFDRNIVRLIDTKNHYPVNCTVNKNTGI